MSEEARTSEDVGEKTPGTEAVAVFGGELKSIARAMGTDTTRRTAGEETRYCIWSGQARDGRKHREDMEGEEPFPFEGAMDGRIRLADMIVNERVLVLLAAGIRSVARVRGMESTDAPLGAKMGTLLKWLVRNVWGSRYIVELMKAAQYMGADSPGVAVIGVFWRQEFALELRTLATEEIRGMLAGMLKGKPEALGMFDQALANPALEDEVSGLLGKFLPMVKKARLKTIVRDLREKGKAEFPCAYQRTNEPVVKALRYMTDIFASPEMSDENKGPWFLREWLSRTELESRVLTMDYSAAFVEELTGGGGNKKGFPGQSAVDSWSDSERMKAGDYSSGSEWQEAHKEKYEVLTAYWQSPDEDGVIGNWVMPFSGLVKSPAAEPELLDYAHGKLPFVVIRREVLTDKAFDSRGIPELVMTQQESLKLFHDGKCDHTQLSVLPPLLRSARRPRISINISPMEEIEIKRPGDVSWMPPPEYPRGNDVQQVEIRRQVDEYFGRLNALVPRELWTLHMEGLVNTFLPFWRDALMMSLQLCQQYLPDETVARVVGGNGLKVARTRQEIQGQFDLDLVFDPMELDAELLKGVAEMVSKVVVPLDTQSTIMRDRLVQWLMTAINPNLAEGTLQPVQAASMRETEDEQGNFVKIAAGIEPPMMQEGQNFALRAQVLMGIGQKNPEAFEKLSPSSQEILKKRMQHLSFMVEQSQNAMIGRTGASPALG